MALSNRRYQALREPSASGGRRRTQIRQLSPDYPGITIDDAYAIQKAWVDAQARRRPRRQGHKIGLTSKAMQSALSIDEPDSGVLLDDMFFADGGLVPTDRFIATRVEAELAFVMKQRARRAGLHDVRRAQRHRLRRARRWKSSTRASSASMPQTKATRKIFDTIADNAANAGIVLGGRPIRPLDDRPALGRRAVLSQRPARGDRAWPPACSIIPPPASPGSPTRSRRMGLRWSPARSFWPARFIRPIETRKGDTIQADYGPWGIGELLLRLTQRDARNHAAFHHRIFGQSRRPPSISARSCEVVPQGRGADRHLPARRHPRPRDPLRALCAIADGRAGLSFLDILLRIGEGRVARGPPEGRRAVFQARLDTISTTSSPPADLRCPSTCRSTTARRAGSAIPFTTR